MHRKWEKFCCGLRIVPLMVRKNFTCCLECTRCTFAAKNTSDVQPLDTSIIAWVQNKVHLRLLFLNFKNIDMGRKSIHKVEISAVTRWNTKKWNKCPAKGFKNYFMRYLKQNKIFDDMKRETDVAKFSCRHEERCKGDRYFIYIGWNRRFTQPWQWEWSYRNKDWNEYRTGVRRNNWKHSDMDCTIHDDSLKLLSIEKEL